MGAHVHPTRGLRMYECTYVCESVCMDGWIHRCMYACVYVCRSTTTQIYTLRLLSATTGHSHRSMRLHWNDEIYQVSAACVFTGTDNFFEFPCAHLRLLTNMRTCSGNSRYERDLSPSPLSKKAHMYKSYEASHMNKNTCLVPD